MRQNDKSTKENRVTINYTQRNRLEINRLHDHLICRFWGARTAARHQRRCYQSPACRRHPKGAKIPPLPVIVVRVQNGQRAPVLNDSVAGGRHSAFMSSTWRRVVLSRIQRLPTTWKTTPTTEARSNGEQSNAVTQRSPVEQREMLTTGFQPEESTMFKTLAVYVCLTVSKICRLVVPGIEQKI